MVLLKQRTSPRISIICLIIFSNSRSILHHLSSTKTNYLLSTLYGSRRAPTTEALTLLTLPETLPVPMRMFLRTSRLLPEWAELTIPLSHLGHSMWWLLSFLALVLEPTIALFFAVLCSFSLHSCLRACF